MDISKYGKERKERIANRLRHERETKVYTFDEGDRKGETLYGLTQDDLAEIIRSTRQTIGTWEKKGGKNKIPNPDTIITLCDLYDCDYGYLICEYDSKRHDVADVRDQIGLSEQTIEELKRFNKPHNKHLYEPLIKLIDQIIADTETITPSLQALFNNSFEGKFDFLENDYDIPLDEIKQDFTKLYNSYNLTDWKKYDRFCRSVKWFFPLGQEFIFNGREYDTHAIIFEIYNHLVDEAEHRTENQLRYSTIREIEKSLDKIINGI